MSKKEKPAEPQDETLLSSHLQEFVPPAEDADLPEVLKAPKLSEEEKQEIIAAADELVAAETPEGRALISVSPTDLADIQIGSVVRFGSAVLRVGYVDRANELVSFLREGGDPESFYTPTELRILILARPDPKTQQYEPWPRVVALNPPAKPKALRPDGEPV
jgi:hypothetical protein